MSSITYFYKVFLPEGQLLILKDKKDGAQIDKIEKASTETNTLTNHIDDLCNPHFAFSICFTASHPSGVMPMISVTTPKV
jgi:hypothetical protein